MALASDPRGFLWVGTQNGLARWDGLQFHTFSASAAPGALPDSQVDTLYVDRRGDLWVGTLSAGLARYDPRNDRFRTYAAKTGGLSHNGVHAVLDAPNGHLWVGTEGGLDELTPETGFARSVNLGATADPEVRKILASGVNALVGDRDTLWIGANRGLIRRDLKTGATAAIRLGSANEPSIRALMIDSAGRLWVGAEGAGAFAIERNGQSVRAIEGSLRKGLDGAGMRVRAILEIKPGEIWLGTYDDGVVSVDAATLKSQRVRLGNGALLYGDQNIRALHRAPGGQVFVAANGAISRYDPRHTAFTALMGGDAPTAVLAERTPVSFLEDGQDRVWIGYISHGVDILDQQTGRLSHAGPKASGLPEAPVRAIIAGRRGVIIGTDSGLYAMDAERRHAQRLAQPGRAPDARVQTLLRDGGRLWLGGRDGLWSYVLDATDHLKLERAIAPEALSDRRIEVTALDRSGMLWIGTDNGLNVFDPKRGVLRHFEPEAGDTTAPRGFISSIYFDRHGRVWVTTFGHGVSVAENLEAAKAQRFRKLDVADGLPNSNTDKVLEDRAGFIWVSTDSGLARVDPATWRVQTFQLAEGVPIGSFFNNAGVATAQGDLLFGGRGGLEVVQPGLLKPIQKTPSSLRITEVRTQGHALAGNPFLGLAPGAALKLPPGGGGLQVGFAALDFGAPERVQYAYRLQGASSEWTEVDVTRRVASFSNLAPRSYVLEIRAASPSGDWRPQVLRLPISVSPAWNQSWWFRAFEELVAIAAVLLLIRWRTAYLDRRRLELEELVVERTHALQAQKDVLEAQTRELEAQAIELADARVRAEAMTQAKSDFLANMSHEIRTPLNGVVAVADMLARADLPARERGMAEIIRASGDTLQRLLSDILDMARIESGKITIETAPFQVTAMLRAVAGLSQLKCDEKGVRLKVEIRPEIDEMVLGDMVRVRQVITNLLSNAAKFTDKGEVCLTAERLANGLARFTVSDTGVGFAVADKAKVLGRFEQADSSITRRFGGTGLGLSICCNLATLMGGELDCDSTPGVGSRFWMDLPLARSEHDSAAAIVAEQVAADEEGLPLRVLLADDHPTNRQVVQLMLEGQAELTCVENGFEAVEAFGSGSFDLILMDMQMPIMDGLTALSAIRRHEQTAGLPRTAAIMLTANALPEHVASAKAAGADLHLSKPFTAPDLFNAIGHVLNIAAMENAA